MKKILVIVMSLSMLQSSYAAREESGPGGAFEPIGFRTNPTKGDETPAERKKRLAEELKKKKDALKHQGDQIFLNTGTKTQPGQLDPKKGSSSKGGTTTKRQPSDDPVDKNPEDATGYARKKGRKTTQVFKLDPILEVPEEEEVSQVSPEDIQTTVKRMTLKTLTTNIREYVRQLGQDVKEVLEKWEYDQAENQRMAQEDEAEKAAEKAARKLKDGNSGFFTRMARRINTFIRRTKDVAPQDMDVSSDVQKDSIWVKIKKMRSKLSFADLIALPKRYREKLQTAKDITYFRRNYSYISQDVKAQVMKRLKAEADESPEVQELLKKNENDENRVFANDVDSVAARAYADIMRENRQNKRVPVSLDDEPIYAEPQDILPKGYKPPKPDPIYDVPQDLLNRN